MKLFLISASPRGEKSQTFRLAQEVLRGIEEQHRDPVEKKIIQLKTCSIRFCTHCEDCHTKILACPIKDDIAGILNAMLTADGIILACPNYINQVPAQLKALFDRSSHFIHCFRLRGKYIAGVVTSGSGQDAAVLDYLAHYSRVCGAQFCGGVSSRAPVETAKLDEAFALGKKLADDIHSQTAYPEDQQAIKAHQAHFGKVMELRRHEWVQEYRYWQEKGWI